jgi:hypothetical protein
MKIGDLIWNHYNGLLRFGTVVDKKIKKDKWAYFIIDWHADEDYEKAQAWRKGLTSTNYTLKEYRGDQLKLFCPQRLERTLKELKKTRRKTNV